MSVSVSVTKSRKIVKPSWLNLQPKPYLAPMPMLLLSNWLRPLASKLRKNRKKP